MKSLKFEGGGCPVAHPCYDAQVIVPLLQGDWAGGGKFENVFFFFSKFTAHKALRIKGSPPCKGVLELDMDMDATGAFSHCLCKCKIRSVGRKRLIIKFPSYRFYG